MDAKELRDAAERLRELKYSDYKFVTIPVFSYEKQEDYIQLAQAWMREHPADDDEAVTEEWLRGVGFNEQNRRMNEETEAELFVCPGGASTFTDIAGDAVWVPTPANRGEARRLATALGIPLTEPRQ